MTIKSLFFLQLIAFTTIKGISLKEDLTLTQKEKDILDKFKLRVISKLPDEYMKDEIYLVRWLRVKRFNLDAAESLLLDNLAWRKRNRMDVINLEDWDDFEAEYKYTIEGCDNEGRPVVSAFVGEWDAREIALSGNGDRFKRYMDHILEDVTELVRMSYKSGRNITQFSLILDLRDYDTIKNGCPQCIPLQLHFLHSARLYYPGTYHKIYIINAPKMFDPVFQIMRNFISSDVGKTVVLFDKDKKRWKAALLEDIKAENLTKAFGGKREAPEEVKQHKKLGYYQC